jgi:hypothetical protein
MRCHASKGDVGDDIPGVITLVRCQRLLVRTRQRTGNPHGRRPLPEAIGWGHLPGHHQTVAVLHQAVAKVAEVGPDTAAIAEQAHLIIAAGTVGLLGEQQTTEISLGELLILAGSSAESLPLQGGGGFSSLRAILSGVRPLGSPESSGSTNSSSRQGRLDDRRVGPRGHCAVARFTCRGTALAVTSRGAGRRASNGL